MDKTGARLGGNVALIGALALAVCCGAPLLIAAIAATGAGAALAALGWPQLGAGMALAGLLVAAWRVRARARDGATGTTAEVTRG